MEETAELILENVNNGDFGGEIVIAPEVLEVIIGISAAKIEGVYGMRGNLASNVNELLGKADHRKGVSLNIDEDGIKVDLYCYLNYGVSVPKVALSMQEKVKEQVLFMTDLELKEVNIHVVGVIPEKMVNPTLDELLQLEEDE
ncbi:Asp23/Gls24 family envelope stress response protein [Vagococcus lutrae]|uniref:Asp23/Gls24 family envelope stress response protein n=1 Tax=Vagococcus lutrae TaxID=81947 RepID=UPI00209799C0|nr:Asp23/Gls24 family envelope stress response protein [Vagococcus lutrae]MCO7151214.1 Asp23/Gls24 family envelope stress response protein [Vagococcus lutrae]MDT2819350.1 Asp23/Gls24 family envelope stress response protein [Vagococcus lutrae]MDT2844163.1 Asp23/Gls24 family envelope stress response protein [Vagococcus lutrae]WCG05753.1 Asp23/Gls24 family envelope stress response protein [Vagococcus lutrae]